MPERFSGAAGGSAAPAGVLCVVRVCAARQWGAPAGDSSARQGPLRLGEGVRNQGSAGLRGPACPAPDSRLSPGTLRVSLPLLHTGLRHWLAPHPTADSCLVLSF